MTKASLIPKSMPKCGWSPERWQSLKNRVGWNVHPPHVPCGGVTAISQCMGKGIPLLHGPRGHLNEEGRNREKGRALANIIIFIQCWFWWCTSQLKEKLSYQEGANHNVIGFCAASAFKRRTTNAPRCWCTEIVWWHRVHSHNVLGDFRAKIVIRGGDQCFVRAVLQGSGWEMSLCGHSA